MARLESKQIMGYLPFEPRHYDAVFSLIAPVTPGYRLLDPFAGEGAFLEAAAGAWQMTPYANELDGDRAASCIERFGPKQAVRCDADRLIASNSAFSVLWCNPPYDHDASASGNKRVEFRYLRHSWKWLQDGGLCFWVVYSPHITEDAAAFLAKYSSHVDVWALPGKHLNQYDQVIVVAIKGAQPDSDALYAQILAQKDNPRLLTVQAEPVYTLPPPPDAGRRFVFAPDTIDDEQGLRLIEEQGAWKTQGFQALLETPEPPAQIEPVVAPRPGHMALVLAAGIADGAVIDTDEYGSVAIRGKTQHVEQVARVDIESDPNEPERQVKKTTIRLKPSTTLTLLADDGTLVEMDGDEALLAFITTNRKALAAYLNNKFNPTYRFDFNGIGRWLSAIRLKGKFPMYTAQKHVVGAITKGFETRKSILLVGSMGSGKTFMGGSAAIAVASGVVESLHGHIRDDQVVLVVAPPHLLDKWKRELHSISSNIYVERLDRHEQVRDFMAKAAKIGSGIAKIGLIKRDLTKLGCSRDVAVVWRNEPVALWRPDQPTPEGYEDHQRITKQRVPLCPHCGTKIMRERKGTLVVASEHWLKSGKRSCSVCHTPLWQEARGRGSRPKPGQKYATKNPRYRLDMYLKRKYPDRVFLLVWDEVHECQSADTGNGESFGRLAGISQKVLGMTGTPFNGRASSMFNLEYHMNERIRQRYPWGGADRLSPKERGSRYFQGVIDGNSRQRGRSESRWVADMGVREMVVEERPTFDSSTGAYTGTSTYQRPYQEAPGISPLLVAEVLDHTIFFGLGDLGKSLPEYEEIAFPVEMDADTYSQYDRTRSQLKDYLIQRRWEGDVGFRGAYLQWSMGWPNAAHRPHEVIHNIKHPITGKKQPYVVTKIPSFGEDRIYAKEQALIDLLTDELAAGRPCVVYLRQTATRDIQPRIESLIRKHVHGAVPYILKNTVSAERREKVIEQQVKAGANIIICNPELTKTGLDLIFAPTIIYAEIVFNLSTMMQAAARSYRLNQTHKHCKVIYMYYEGTMEHTAVQLMSRKQRAAKLLTGDIGLTGLDAITEGEGGFETALMDAIARDETLLDPSEMFKVSAGQSEIDVDDAAFWNVEVDDDEVALDIVSAESVVEPDETEAVSEEDTATATPAITATGEQDTRKVQRFVRRYLETVCILSDVSKQSALQAEVIQTMLHGVLNDDDTRQVVGMLDADFVQYPVHEKQLVKWLRKWLKQKRFVFTGCEDEVAQKAVTIAKQALGMEPLQLDVFEALQDMQDEQHQTQILDDLNDVEARPLPEKKPVGKGDKKTIDLLAVPEDSDDSAARKRPFAQPPERDEPHNPPKQLAMF